MPRKRRKADEKSAASAAIENAVGSEDDESQGRGLEGAGLGGVVKVFCTRTKPNRLMPWQMERQESCAGSGCLLRGRRIVSNAHVVEFGSLITILKHGDPKRYLAKIVVLGQDYDLALLEVVEEADAFWQGAVPFSFGDLPALNSSVIILGYPTDVDSVSVTEGVVSRVMMSAYAHSHEELLKLQVDAAVNPGNSGGPVIHGGRLVGVVSEQRLKSQGIGFAVPILMVQHFLTQVERYQTPLPICRLGIDYLKCENPSLRSFYQLDSKEHGIAISSVIPLSPCLNKLEVNDVLMSIDGVAIADDGTVELRKSQERVKFTFLLSTKHWNDTCQINFKRGPKRMQTTVHFATKLPIRYTPCPMVSPYVVWAGLVFVECSIPYLLDAFADGEGGIDYEQLPLDLQIAWFRKEKQTPEQQVVVLGQVLSDGLCQGYMHYQHRVVESINGALVKNLHSIHDVLQRLEPDKTPFVKFQLDNHDAIILDTKKAAHQHPTILNNNNISKPHLLQ